jgi:UDP:flavonoid glycosyltransferase YjiC (YdhE family)
VVQQGARPLPNLEFIHEGDLNLYVYPKIADYTDARPLGPTWHRLDSSVRETDDDFTLPDGLADRPDGSALIYFSLGSLGSADVGLMRRVIASLARTPHRYIVSKGPLHDEIELPPPCGERSSSRRRGSFRWSISSSHTAATTRPPSASSSASP